MLASTPRCPPPLPLPPLSREWMSREPPPLLPLPPPNPYPTISASWARPTSAVEDVGLNVLGCRADVLLLSGTNVLYIGPLLSWCLTSTEARWPIRDGDRVGRGRESERLDRGNRPKKTGETVDRRQNNGSVKAVSPRHCPATCALRNCSFNCCAGQSH